MIRPPASLALTAALTAALALALAGCGRKAEPHSPEGAFYPQQYPALVLPNPPAGPSEPLAEQEYQQMQQTRQRNPAPPAAAPAAPAPTTFQDLHHPEADSTPGTTTPGTTP